MDTKTPASELEAEHPHIEDPREQPYKRVSEARHQSVVRTDTFLSDDGQGTIGVLPAANFAFKDAATSPRTEQSSPFIPIVRDGEGVQQNEWLHARSDASSDADLRNQDTNPNTSGSTFQLNTAHVIVYFKTTPNATGIQGLANWRDVGANLAIRLSLMGLVNGNASQARTLMMLPLQPEDPNPATLKVRLNHLSSSLAEILAIGARGTLLSSLGDAPFVEYRVCHPRYQSLGII